MQIQVADVLVDVQKKRIKNMHLRVKPPYGNVVVSAPLRVNRAVIEGFVRSNLPWVRKQIKRIQNSPLVPAHRYISGEAVYLWGQKYALVVIESAKPAYRIMGDKLLIYLPKKASVEWRDRFMREVYRTELIKQAAVLLPKWERITGLKAHEWRTKYMKTRWGTCNIVARRIWLNVQLAQKPLICLEYVILHELTHLLERYHNARFYAHVERFMADWQEVRARLNAPVSAREK
ncbi:MAG: M48 family metallopeptidase [Selenomonas sp.]|uniref:M48 family metallopeptidase n=1 Tax=Selenomonas sp. TaxID=2053611 RepID=UPI0025EC7488|nr:SprT family zinc-dependent metalloprotease [Selenomonas sp.]MCR5757833.1 M48 family metallopeptidase [Selenomonas sp.]